MILGAAWTKLQCVVLTRLAPDADRMFGPFLMCPPLASLARTPMTKDDLREVAAEPSAAYGPSAVRDFLDIGSRAEILRAVDG